MPAAPAAAAQLGEPHTVLEKVADAWQQARRIVMAAPRASTTRMQQVVVVGQAAAQQVAAAVQSSTAASQAWLQQASGQLHDRTSHAAERLVSAAAALRMRLQAAGASFRSRLPGQQPPSSSH